MNGRRRRPTGHVHIREIDPEENAEEEETEDETDSETEGESEEDEQQQTVDYIQLIESPRVSPSIGASVSVQLEKREKREREEKGGEACSSLGSQENEWNRSEIDGLFCSICMEAWTNDGDHHICCLPCGHIYGFSCIKKWLQQRPRSAKCPQCNRKCTLKDVRKLFASRIAAVDEESHKRIRSLEASLEMTKADLCRKEVELKNTKAELQLKVNLLMERNLQLESSLASERNNQSMLVAGGYQAHSFFGQNICSQVRVQGTSCGFISQDNLRVDGARLFELDPSRQVILLARKLFGNSGSHILTKMSLIAPHETEDIILPPSTRAIKDLHLSPINNGLALFASLGKKLSIVSMESNNIVLSYDLPVAAWSCSWDLNSSHIIYAGLQNGLLLVFDMRQTMRPMESLNGLTNNPIHTIHSLKQNSTLPSGSRVLLSASSVGLCQWTVGGVHERPFLVPETGSEGVCISSAYCPSSGDIITSHRPRIEQFNEIAASQPLLTPYPLNANGVQGSHTHFKRSLGGNNYQKLGSAYANVSNVLLPKTTIIDRGNQKPLFVSLDECTSEFLLQELPSFTVVQRLKSAKYPIHDLKYTQAFNQGLLGCLSEDTLQLFSTRL